MASIKIPIAANASAIIEAAGGITGVESDSYVHHSILHCPDVSQETLDAVVTAYDHEAYLRDQALAQLIKSKQQQASEEILKLAPEWKQRNILAQSLILIATQLNILDSPESSEMRDLWNKIDKIRKDSNETPITEDDKKKE